MKPTQMKSLIFSHCGEVGGHTNLLNILGVSVSQISKSAVWYYCRSQLKPSGVQVAFVRTHIRLITGPWPHLAPHPWDGFILLSGHGPSSEIRTRYPSASLTSCLRLLKVMRHPICAFVKVRDRISIVPCLSLSSFFLFQCFVFYVCVSYVWGWTG